MKGLKFLDLKNKDFEEKWIVTHSSSIIDEKFLKNYTHALHKKDISKSKKQKVIKDKQTENKLSKRAEKYKVSDNESDDEDEDSEEENENSEALHTDKNMIEESKEDGEAFDKVRGNQKEK